MDTCQDFKKNLLKELVDLLVVMGIEECLITDKYSLDISPSGDLQIKSSCGPLKNPKAITPMELVNSTDYNIFEVIINSIRKHVV